MVMSSLARRRNSGRLSVVSAGWFILMAVSILVLFFTSVLALGMLLIIPAEGTDDMAGIDAEQSLGTRLLETTLGRLVAIGASCWRRTATLVLAVDLLPLAASRIVWLTLTRASSLDSSCQSPLSSFPLLRNRAPEAKTSSVTSRTMALRADLVCCLLYRSMDIPMITLYRWLPACSKHRLPFPQRMSLGPTPQYEDEEGAEGSGPFM